MDDGEVRMMDDGEVRMRWMRRSQDWMDDREVRMGG